MEAIRDGELPPPPIAMLMQFDIDELAEGRVVFSCRLDESVYNPIGVVHGGLVCTLLDTVAGCAVHTTLPQGMAYTSIELKVNYLRPVHTTADRSPRSAAWSRPAAGSPSPKVRSATPPAGSSRRRRARSWSSRSRRQGPRHSLLHLRFAAGTQAPFPRSRPTRGRRLNGCRQAAR